MPVTQVSKPISPKLNVFEGHALTDDELDAVSGGDSDMTRLSTAAQQMQCMISAVDSVIKNIGR
jgi:hypothetical protein